jgi:hypothetical protein
MVSTRSTRKKEAVRPEAVVKRPSTRKQSDYDDHGGVQDLEIDVPAEAAVEVDLVVVDRENDLDPDSIAPLGSPVKSPRLPSELSEGHSEAPAPARGVKSAPAKSRDLHVASKAMETQSKTPTKDGQSEQVGNELTKLIPGYVAPLALDTSSLDRYRPSGGLSELCRRAEQTDASTAGFVVNAVDTRPMKRATSGFMPTTYASLYSSFRQGTKRAPDQSAGKGWFGMVPTPLTEDIKTDLAVIRNRNYLDPKRFYKSADNRKNKTLVQLGTVVEGSAEFYSSRLAKKQRRGNLTEEIMADPSAASYTKNKYKAMQQTKSEKGRNSYKKKLSRKARRGC